MFNGIVFNTGVINEIKTNKNSKLIGIKTNLKLKKERLRLINSMRWCLPHIIKY